MSAPLRSSAWFDGDDEVALAHRVAVRMAGASVEQGRAAPVVMIVDTSSELNPCNLPLRALAEDVRRGVLAAGGVPLVAPAMSLGEDLMKPSAMLYRGLLSIEVEELVRANPVDGVVLLVNCDKTVPGALLGAISADVPTIAVIGGNRPAPLLHGRRLGTGTDLWQALHERRSGRMDEARWREFESAYSCGGNGTCNTAGTASSMAVAAEALGFVLPGGSSVQAGGSRRPRDGARSSSWPRGSPPRGCCRLPRCATRRGPCRRSAARRTPSSISPRSADAPASRCRRRPSPRPAMASPCSPTSSPSAVR